MVITVWDSLGNKSALTLEGITLDGNTPGITNLFPTKMMRPKTRTTRIGPPSTRSPRTRSSISTKIWIRCPYVIMRQGGGTAIMQAYAPGNARLETVGSLVRLAGERYHLHRSPEVRSGGAGDRPRGQRQRDEGRYAHVQRRLYESGRRYVQGCAGC